MPTRHTGVFSRHRNLSFYLLPYRQKLITIPVLAPIWPSQSYTFGPCFVCLFPPVAMWHLASAADIFSAVREHCNDDN